MNIITRVHLADGTTLDGRPTKPGEVSAGDIDQMKEALKEYLVQEAWQVNLETESGWVIVPGRHVLYIEIVETT